MPAPGPSPQPPLRLPSEEESLEALIARSARIRRTADALARRMKQLDARIAEAKARRRDSK